MGRRGFLGTCAAIIIGVLPGCSQGRPTGRYNFRMTVAVDTPQGLRAGSSVYEVKGITTHDPFRGNRGQMARIRGEAVAVDLPNGKTVFATMSSERHPNADSGLAVLSISVLDPSFENDWQASARRIELGEGREGSVALKQSDYPYLAVFRDIQVPSSVERIDPDNASATLGNGYQIQSISMEVTYDPVTVGLENRLPWLREYFSKRFDIKRITDASSFANLLSSGALTARIIK